MLILFLDDDHFRHITAEERFKHHDLYHVWTVPQLRHALRRRRFDVVYLDHDLGTPETGFDAALFIAALPADRKPDLTVVHSWNPVGAENMVAALRASGTPVARRAFSFA